MTLMQFSFLVIAALLSIGLERFRQPLRPGLGAPGLHLLVMAGLFLTAYSLSRRFYFSLLAALCAQLVVLIVNNAKYRFLREPLVFADFALYSQAIRFPRLYLPFVGVGPALFGSLAIAGSITIAILFEPASGLLAAAPLADRLATLALLLLSLALIVIGGRRREISLDAGRDTLRYGLLPTLAIYGAQTRAPEKMAPAPLPQPDARPNLIAIQSESFFDARRLDGNIRRSLLGTFDRLCDESLACGRLRVPAWGAYTMRSEFSFLTGRANDSLGFGRFDPLRFFSGRIETSGIVSMAAHLKQQGYRCICIHPYPVEFFARHRIYPELGFDDFIDIRAFEAAGRFGPYVSDEAVCDRIIRELDGAGQPLFIFAITMENHGPLHLETITAEARNRFFESPTGGEDDNLAIYLRHLQNADRMLERLTQHLAQHDPEAVLGWYGDHVPGMPDIYKARDYQDPCTDYLVWSAARTGTAPRERRETSVEALPTLMLSATRQQKDQQQKEQCR